MSFTFNNTIKVKQQAKQLGFDYCGIAKAVKLEEDAKRLENWLNKGFNGSMQYMENHFDLRIDPSKLVPYAKSQLHYYLVIFLLHSKILMRQKFQNMLLVMITTK